MDQLFDEESNPYHHTRQILEQWRYRVGERPLMSEIDRLEAWNLNGELDLLIAEFLYGRCLEGH